MYCTILVSCIHLTKRIAFGYATEMRSFAFRCLIRKFDLPRFQVGEDYRPIKLKWLRLITCNMEFLASYISYMFKHIH